MHGCQDVQTDMGEHWPLSWEALLAGPRPTEKTHRSAERAGLPGLHFFCSSKRILHGWSALVGGGGPGLCGGAYR